MIPLHNSKINFNVSRLCQRLFFLFGSESLELLLDSDDDSEEEDDDDEESEELLDSCFFFCLRLKQREKIPV